MATTGPEPQVFELSGTLWKWRLCERVCGLLLVSPDGIVAHFKKQVGPASVVLTDEDQFQKFISNEDASVIGESFTSDSLQI